MRLKTNYLSKNIFFIVGNEHNQIMRNLNVNFIIFNLNTKLNQSQTLKLKRLLNNFECFFISSVRDDLKSYLKALIIEFKKITNKLYLIDLEILKAIELVSQKELELNECIFGIQLPKNYTLKNYLDDILKDETNDTKNIFEYFKNLLELETKRLLNV